MAPIGPVKSVTITNPHFSTGDSGVERISMPTKTTDKAVSTNQVRIIPLNIWNSHNASLEHASRSLIGSANCSEVNDSGARELSGVRFTSGAIGSTNYDHHWARSITALLRSSAAPNREMEDAYLCLRAARYRP